MIKTGIYGSAKIDDPVRKQLLRLLLRHPDVDLRAVASPAGNTVPLAELHPVFAGETELRLERELHLDGLDVLFVIDEKNLTDDIVEKYAADTDFRLIVLGEAPALLDKCIAGSTDYVYGLPEYFRKPLVRGARAAVSPRPEAILLELALLPLAKKSLIGAPVEATVATPCAARLNDAAAEAAAVLSAINNAPVSIDARTAAEPPYHRIDLQARIDTAIAIEEVERIYAEAYDDHSFVHILPAGVVLDEDLRGSNKCLIQLSEADGKLCVTASLDALTKGCTGNAVHLMDLLFGLHERTGLSI
ncbi:MAG: hypothetical protein NC418_05850 [Muribaculaceae bacterium]|nr:hypothetical protein [Muribaculaceae bacterium]